VRLYDRVLGTPWIYEKLRVFVLGGGPAERVFQWLGDTQHDVLVDVGCGTGMAMDHLGAFHSYHGFDVDERALRRFRERSLPDNVFLYCQTLTAADIERIRPTKAILVGLLHHLSQVQALELLSVLAHGAWLKRAITLDPVFVKGRLANNLFCGMDRGRYVRTVEGYLSLVDQSRFNVLDARTLRSGNGLASYFCMCLGREGG